MSIIEAGDINSSTLATLFSSAGLVSQVDDDGEIYIKEGLDFPCWVAIDEEKKCIRIHSWVKCKDGAPLDRLDEFAALLNSKYFLTQFSATTYEDGRGYVNGHYYMFYSFGIIPGQLTHTVRKFADIFISAIRAEDQDDTFFG